MLEYWAIQEWDDLHGWLPLSNKTFDTKEDAEAYMATLPKYKGYPTRVYKYIIEDFD